MSARIFVPGRDKKSADAWRWECLQNGWPFVLVDLSDSRLEIELRHPWALTQRLWWRLHHALEGDECLGRTGDSIWLARIAPEQTERRALQVLECIQQCKPEPDEAFDIPPEFASGQAECVWAEGFKGELRDGQFYAIQEIPNMAGHVVVWRKDQPPMVGIHLERFRFAYPDERAFLADQEQELRARVAEIWGAEHQLALLLSARRDHEHGPFQIARLSATLELPYQPEPDAISRLSECLRAIPDRGDSLCIRSPVEP